MILLIYSRFAVFAVFFATNIRTFSSWWHGNIKTDREKDEQKAGEAAAAAQMDPETARETTTTSTSLVLGMTNMAKQQIFSPHIQIDGIQVQQQSGNYIVNETVVSVAVIQ
jgi:hypothetical protein